MTYGDLQMTIYTHAIILYHLSTTTVLPQHIGKRKVRNNFPDFVSPQLT